MIKEIVIKAYNFAEKKHDGQTRKYCDKPYIIHAKYVARIVEQLTKDPELVAVALLHDVLEDTDTSFEELKEEFGEEIAKLVNELTNRPEELSKLNKKEYTHWKIRHISSDALTVKLADRLHNILFLEKDCSNTTEFGFLKQYYINTCSVMEDLDKDVILNKVQKAIYDRIKAVLKFLEIRYFLA